MPLCVSDTSSVTSKAVAKAITVALADAVGCKTPEILSFLLVLTVLMRNVMQMNAGMRAAGLMCPYQDSDNIALVCCDSLRPITAEANLSQQL